MDAVGDHRSFNLVSNLVSKELEHIKRTVTSYTEFFPIKKFSKHKGRQGNGKIWSKKVVKRQLAGTDGYVSS